MIGVSLVIIRVMLSMCCTIQNYKMDSILTNSGADI